jgi:predicted RNA-binding Zn ribbon-like protein
LGQTYLSIVKPANDAIDRFEAKAKSWDDNATGEQAAKDAAPAVAAIREADNKLLRVAWPASTAADVKELVRAHGSMTGDLDGLEGVNALSAGAWTTQLTQDAGKASAAANIVRADLGLPPSD